MGFHKYATAIAPKKSRRPFVFSCEARAQTLVVRAGRTSEDVNDETVNSTTNLSAIPRAGHIAIHWVYERIAMLDSITTPFKSNVPSGEESSFKETTRTAFCSEFHTRESETFARIKAIFDHVKTTSY